MYSRREQKMATYRSYGNQREFGTIHSAIAPYALRGAFFAL